MEVHKQVEKERNWSLGELTESLNISYICVRCTAQYSLENVIMTPGAFEFTFESQESSEIYPQRQTLK